MLWFLERERAVASGIDLILITTSGAELKADGGDEAADGEGKETSDHSQLVVREHA